MAEKLKPCPFCGGNAKLEKVNGFVIAKCGYCGAESGCSKLACTMRISKP